MPDSEPFEDAEEPGRVNADTLRPATTRFALPAHVLPHSHEAPIVEEFHLGNRDSRENARIGARRDLKAGERASNARSGTRFAGGLHPRAPPECDHVPRRPFRAQGDPGGTTTRHASSR
jgi:hypothetical protein